MYARLVRRSLWQRKSRALVALAALTVATTLTAALLNLYFYATRKLRSEFRRYGANLMLTPRATAGGAELLDATLTRQLEEGFVPEPLSTVVPYLYAVVELRGESVVLAGARGSRFPAAAVNPLRQVTEAEFRVVERIRWVLLGTTLVVLVVTGLCVLATMTALAFERRQTIGTMKALGATNLRLSLLFLSEAAALALVASAAGFLGGLALARWVGATLFAPGGRLGWGTLPLVLAGALR